MLDLGTRSSNEAGHGNRNRVEYIVGRVIESVEVEAEVEVVEVDGGYFGNICHCLCAGQRPSSRLSHQFGGDRHRQGPSLGFGNRSGDRGPGMSPPLSVLVFSESRTATLLYMFSYRNCSQVQSTFSI